MSKTITALDDDKEHYDYHCPDCRKAHRSYSAHWTNKECIKCPESGRLHYIINDKVAIGHG